MVGYLAVHRLVIRHVGSLKRDMRAFAMHRTLAAEEPDPRMSAELADIKTEFLHMADSLLRDEAALEDALREKNELLEQKTVLMKEVHHRVKNNLQLISSIMNMQMRKAENPETRAVLSRLQDRIIGLAAVHRDLYQAGASGAVDASALVSQIANQLLGSGEAPDLQMHSNYDEIVLYPDQAVPLALLAAEALTNATKYAEAPDPDSAPRVEVSFLRDAGDTVTFEVSNTVADGARSHGPTGDGLGAKLIEAFARQLEGELFSGRDGRAHVVRLTFKVANFRPAADEDSS